jgi:hypothetical protein
MLLTLYCGGTLRQARDMDIVVEHEHEQEQEQEQEHELEWACLADLSKCKHGTRA